jgi:hypothetical protein
VTNCLSPQKKRHRFEDELATMALKAIIRSNFKYKLRNHFQALLTPQTFQSFANISKY